MGNDIIEKEADSQGVAGRGRRWKYAVRARCWERSLGEGGRVREWIWGWLQSHLNGAQTLHGM